VIVASGGCPSAQRVVHHWSGLNCRGRPEHETNPVVGDALAGEGSHSLNSIGAWSFSLLVNGQRIPSSVGSGTLAESSTVLSKTDRCASSARVQKSRGIAGMILRSRSVALLACHESTIPEVPIRFGGLAVTPSTSEIALSAARPGRGVPSAERRRSSTCARNTVRCTPSAHIRSWFTRAAKLRGGRWLSSRGLVGSTHPPPNGGIGRRSGDR
jgi:hypothetical protein